METSSTFEEEKNTEEELTTCLADSAVSEQSDIEAFIEPLEEVLVEKEPSEEEPAQDDSAIIDKYNVVVESSTYDTQDIPTDETCVSLVTIKERRLLNTQNALKKSIRVSLKSFLISVSLMFLNLFI